MTTLVKLGGSVLTDRVRLFSFERANAVRLAAEIARSGEIPVLVHGTGRAGKAFARHYRPGSRSTDNATVFELTTAAIRQLGEQLCAALRDEGVPHCPIGANALFTRLPDRRLSWRGPEQLQHLLDCGVVPVLAGDVLVEQAHHFSVVSSDEIMAFLAGALPARAAVFVTDVDGLLDARGRLVPTVLDRGDRTATNAGTWACDRDDVTGGMAEKIDAAIQAARFGNRVTIVNGLVPGRLRDALCDRPVIGSRVLAPTANGHAPEISGDLTARS
jgi:isopentenyl phosphate kinase